MKYAVLKVVNGNYAIHAEGITDVNSAKVTFHGLCQSLWNTSNVETACVMVADENFGVVQGYIENISHAEPEGV